MMLDELKKQLVGYEIATITRQSFGHVFEIYDTNQDFFLLTQGKKATIESSINDIDSIPPNIGIEQKIFVSIWADGKAIGILDLLKDYPEQNYLWIGLLLIHGDMCNKKIGSKIVAAILNASRIEGFKFVQLGVMENNVRGMAFWKKCGFAKVRTKENIIVMERSID
jgi:ribosomal protein S18 acetylase RimI-like enzyme